MAFHNQKGIGHRSHGCPTWHSYGGWDGGYPKRSHLSGTRKYISMESLGAWASGTAEGFRVHKVRHVQDFQDFLRKERALQDYKNGKHGVQDESSNKREIPHRFLIIQHQISLKRFIKMLAQGLCPMPSPHNSNRIGFHSVDAHPIPAYTINLVTTSTS